MRNWDTVIDVDFTQFDKVTTRKQRQHISYYNIPCSYDIETSSFRNEQDEAVSITYSHALNIDGENFLARTWDEFKFMIDNIIISGDISLSNRLIIYVHNLSYEFQFMKKHFEWMSVFSNGKERSILTATTKQGIEFRCSMMLAGGSLANTARNLTKFKIKKMEGDLDYELIRTPFTPLTTEELGYIKNDIVIIEYFIREAMSERNNDITKLPLTNTGYVRDYVRSQTIYSTDKKTSDQYKELMIDLTVDTNEYMALRQAFQGGFTHANISKTGITQENVVAKDFVSSYPGRMIAYKYPMSSAELYDVKSKKDFYDVMNTHCLLFYVVFDGIARKANEAYISSSKCLVKKNVTTNNGRIETAERIEMWITDVDFEMIAMSYEIDDFSIGTLYRYQKGYLPTPFVKSIIKLFEDKTKLKGIDDRQADYNRSKGMLNSTYGMCVMDIIQDEYTWNDEEKYSKKGTPDIFALIQKHNNSQRRFLSYAWGVWITAYARYDLFQDIIRLGDDYIYSDTDSVYYLNEEENEHIFESSNKRIERQLQLASNHHGFDVSELSPVDKWGNHHTIGLWSLDGRYDKFKTLGAKRYMVESEGEVNITVSGINKSVAVPYLKEEYGDNIFDAFDDGLVVPEGKCGKKTHTYIDDYKVGVVDDYLGESYEYDEWSGVHLEETSYALTISDEYAEMIEWVRQRNV